jgi:hypothetical protein
MKVISDRSSITGFQLHNQAFKLFEMFVFSPAWTEACSYIALFGQQHFTFC